MELSAAEKVIVEMMLGMVYDRACEIYSEELIEHGLNKRNYGIMDAADGYAKIKGS